MLLINNYTFPKTEEKRKIAFRQHSELLPSDFDSDQLGDLERADLAFNAGRKKIRQNRNAILILSFVLMVVFPFSLFIGIPAALIYSIFAKQKLGARQITPYARLDAHAETWNSTMQWCYFVLWIIAAVFALICAGLEYTAGSRVKNADSSAKSVYNAAKAYQNELCEQGLDPKLETVIVSPQDPRTEGTLAYGIHPYYSDGDRYWYAVVCDENGNITAAYWCRTELTPEKLIPPAHEDQLETAKSLFHRDELIGYYQIQNEGDL